MRMTFTGNSKISVFILALQFTILQDPMVPRGGPKMNTVSVTRTSPLACDGRRDDVDGRMDDRGDRSHTRLFM